MRLTRLQFIPAGFLFWCGFFVLPVFSQIQTKDFEVVSNPATVGGTVSTEGKAAANISIGVTKASANWNDKPEATTKPDTDGKFLLENLPAGSYYLRPEVPGFVFPDEKDAKIVELNVGEAAENIDLRTGRKGRAFNISGKLYNEETGEPFEKTRAYAMAIPTEEEADFGFSNDSIKEDGNFDLKGFLPGKYILQIRFFSENEAEFFSPSTDI